MIKIKIKIKNTQNFKNRLDWTPNSGRDRWLDMYVEQVRDDIIKGLSKDFKMNIAK